MLVSRKESNRGMKTLVTAVGLLVVAGCLAGCVQQPSTVASRPTSNRSYQRFDGSVGDCDLSKVGGPNERLAMGGIKNIPDGEYQGTYSCLMTGLTYDPPNSDAGKTNGQGLTIGNDGFVHHEAAVPKLEGNSAGIQVTQVDPNGSMDIYVPPGVRVATLAYNIVDDEWIKRCPDLKKADGSNYQKGELVPIYADSTHSGVVSLSMDQRNGGNDTCRYFADELSKYISVNWEGGSAKVKISSPRMIYIGGQYDIFAPTSVFRNIPSSSSDRPPLFVDKVACVNYPFFYDHNFKPVMDVGVSIEGNLIEWQKKYNVPMTDILIQPASYYPINLPQNHVFEGAKNTNFTHKPVEQGVEYRIVPVVTVSDSQGNAIDNNHNEYALFGDSTTVVCPTDLKTTEKLPQNYFETDLKNIELDFGRISDAILALTPTPLPGILP
jgi:hypothetical protein